MSDAKTELRKELVRHGVTSLEELKKRYPLGCAIDDRQLQSWMRKSLAPSDLPPLRDKPRLINRFKLGADPEFVMVDGRERRVNAEHLRLHVGKAFGADLNGRLVEIRPKAYRNALKVLASTLHTMRWLALCPEVHNANTKWVAGAYMFDDGLGGHVHLGRKRELKKVSRFAAEHRREFSVPEITALDSLAFLLIELGAFPREECLRRRAGDSHGQIYGAFGDVRIQAHGYEYRTFPSWLDSPWLAYFVLVLSKLVILDPEITKGWASRQSDACLRNILAYYKGRDDDAWLAAYALKRHGLPQHIGGDFKARWGLNYPKHCFVQLIPTTMNASKEAIHDLYNYLALEKPIPATMPQVNWEPSNIPKDYVLMTSYCRTIGCKGLGDIIWDACTHESFPIGTSTDNGAAMVVSSDLVKNLPAGWQAKLRTIYPQLRFDTVHDGSYRLFLGAKLREPRMVPITRKLLFSGVFPIWSAKDVKASSFSAWQETAKKATQKPKVYLGREIVNLGVNLT